MKKALFLLIGACFSLIASAQESQTVFNFLRLPVSSHAAALGGDNISLIEDDDALSMNNPALLASVTDKTVALGYMNYMSGCHMFFGGYSFTQGEKATIGVNAQYMNYGSIKATNPQGEITSEYAPYELALSGTLAYNLANKLVGGITARFIYAKIGCYSSSAAAVDLGINYFDDQNDFSASMVVKNIGGQLSAWDEEFESMPSDLQIGVTKGFEKMPIRVSVTAVDLTRWNYSFWRHLVIGADILLGDQIYLSAGYNLRRAHEMEIQTTDSYGDSSTSSHMAGFSCGGGINLDRFSIGVSYAKYHVSSSSLMFNASYRL